MESHSSVTNDLAHGLAHYLNSTHQQTHHHTMPVVSTQCVCFQCQQPHATWLSRSPTLGTSSSVTTLQHVQHVVPHYAYSEDRVQRVFQQTPGSYPVVQASHVQAVHGGPALPVHDTIHGLAVAVERSVANANARIEKLESTVSALSHFLLQAQGIQPTRIDPAPHTSQIRREESVPPPATNPDAQDLFAELTSRLEDKVETLFAKLTTAVEKMIPIANVLAVTKHEIGINTSSPLGKQYSDVSVQSGILDTVAVGVDARPLPAEKSSPSSLLQPPTSIPVSSSLNTAASTSATSTGSSIRRSTLPLPRRTQLPKVPPPSTPVQSFDDSAPHDWGMPPLTSPETSPVSRLPLPRSNTHLRKRQRTEIETTRGGSIGIEIRKTGGQTAELTSLLSQGSSATHYIWPTKKVTRCVDQRKFVQCDNCKAWYHFACVNLTDEDSKLKDEFYCPPCAYSPADRESCTSTAKKSSQACGRPDCNCPQSSSDKNEYFIERIIGRKPYVLRQGPRQNNFADFLWLVKWEGYPVSRATWTLPDDLGKGDEFIEQFMGAATEEALDLSDPQRTIVLREASLVGW